MAITEQQNIPIKEQEKQKWTFRKLFPLNTIATLIKPFSEPLDILLGYCVIVIGLSQLLKQSPSWAFFVTTILVLIANIYERHNKPKV